MSTPLENARSEPAKTMALISGSRLDQLQSGAQLLHHRDVDDIQRRIAERHSRRRRL
jgi:hypothetical protein